MLLLQTLGLIAVHGPLYLPELYMSFMPQVNNGGFPCHFELAALETEASKASKNVTTQPPPFRAKTGECKQGGILPFSLAHNEALSLFRFENVGRSDAR